MSRNKRRAYCEANWSKPNLSVRDNVNWVQAGNPIMTLSPKAIRFVVEALDYYLQDRDQQLRHSAASDDELADWENDRQFLEAIKQDCLDHLAQPLEAAHVEV